MSTSVLTYLYLCQPKNTSSCYPQISRPSSLPLPESLPPFYVSLSAHQCWVWNKEPSGHGYLPAQVGLYTEKTASLQHLSARIKDISVYPLNSPSHFLSFPPSLPLTLLFLPPKLSHTLNKNQTKCGTLLPIHVSLRLCHFPALLFALRVSCILPDCFVFCSELFQIIVSLYV